MLGIVRQPLDAGYNYQRAIKLMRPLISAVLTMQRAAESASIKSTASVLATCLRHRHLRSAFALIRLSAWRRASADTAPHTLSQASAVPEPGPLSWAAASRAYASGTTEYTRAACVEAGMRDAIRAAEAAVSDAVDSRDVNAIIADSLPSPWAADRYADRVGARLAAARRAVGSAWHWEDRGSDADAPGRRPFVLAARSSVSAPRDRLWAARRGAKRQADADDCAVAHARRRLRAAQNQLEWFAGARKVWARQARRARLLRSRSEAAAAAARQRQAAAAPSVRDGIRIASGGVRRQLAKLTRLRALTVAAARGAGDATSTAATALARAAQAAGAAERARRAWLACEAARVVVARVEACLRSEADARWARSLRDIGPNWSRDWAAIRLGHAGGDMGNILWRQ